MTAVLDDLLGALKDGRAGRQPDPSSTRGSNPKGGTPESVESSGPLHRISEASVTGTATVEAEPDAVNVVLTLPEEESPAMLYRRDALDAACDAPTVAYWPDSDELEAEQRRWRRHQAKREALGLGPLDVLDEETGEVWQMPPLSPERQAKLDRSKARQPIQRLADEEAPAAAEPISPGRTPGADHPWRRDQDPAKAGDRRAA